MNECHQLRYQQAAPFQPALSLVSYPVFTMYCVAKFCFRKAGILNLVGHFLSPFLVKLTVFDLFLVKR